MIAKRVPEGKCILFGFDGVWISVGPRRYNNVRLKIVAYHLIIAATTPAPKQTLSHTFVVHKPKELKVNRYNLELTT